MQHYLKIIFLSVLTATITSCSHIYGEEGLIRSRDTTYLQAKSIPPLHIPPNLSSSKIQTYYPVSNTHSIRKENVDLTPPELYNPANTTR